MRKAGKASLLAGAFIAATLAAAPGLSWAQTSSDTTSPPPPPPKPSSTSTEVSGVVVTGSRVKATSYNSPSPITVISGEQAALTGAVDTAGLLQQSSAANGYYQINNAYTGYNVTGGDGTNTLNLRGLGSNRTLILIDGQRMGPAGVGGTVQAVDLNTIPSSIIDHVEELLDGASSIYGSDAVAGVVNIITKKNLDGGVIDIIGNPSEEGGANTYDVNGAWGKTFDRGYFNAGFDFYQQGALRNSQRPYLACERDLATYPGGKSADVIDPATGRAKCWNLEGPDVIDYADDDFYKSAPGTVGGTGPMGLNIPGYAVVGLPQASVADTRASFAQFPYAPEQYEQGTALSPVTRYTLTAAGGFNLTPHAQIYGTLLLNQRDSLQDTPAQFFGLLNPDYPTNPGFGFPEPIIPFLSQSSQRVNYERAVLGVKGDLPTFFGLSGWTYDLYGQVSASQGSYTAMYALNDRVNATTGAGAGTNGCDPTAIAPYGYGSTMADLEPGVACVPTDFFQDVAQGYMSPSEMAFLFKKETGHTTYNQYYVDGSANGNLVKLPAGDVTAAVGFELRREEIDDTPPPDVVDGNAYNTTVAGVTKGAEESEEIYGELNVPVIKNVPFIESFDADISGRISHYGNYGTNGTFKLGLTWRVNDWLRLEATDSTAFRAPALYEQYLANQSGFYDQTVVDPCVNYGTTSVSANVKANCAAQGLPNNFEPTAPSAEVFTGGGPGLKPETALDQTVGFVLTPKIWNLNLQVAVTYWSYDITNEITDFGAANIIYQCYNSPNLSSPFCSLFAPRTTDPASQYYQSFTTINDDYVNVARQIDQGLDLNVRYIRDLPWDNKLTVDGSFSWTFYSATSLLGGSSTNYLGQVGEPAFVGNINFKIDHGPWTINYYLDLVGKSSDNDFNPQYDYNYLDTGQTVHLNHTAPLYTLSDLSIRRKLDTITLTVGIKNLFNQEPPEYASEGFQYRQGTVPLASQYDLVGRSYFVNLSKKF
jgi:iron complex outermembrane receptor protein